MDKVLGEGQEGSSASLGWLQQCHDPGHLASVPIWYHARYTWESYAHLCPVYQPSCVSDSHMLASQADGTLEDPGAGFREGTGYV